MSSGYPQYPQFPGQNPNPQYPPSTTQSSYPYPGTQPTSYYSQTQPGFNINTPYPPSTSSYPPTSSPYPPSTSPYPPTSSPYPQSSYPLSNPSPYPPNPAYGSSGHPPYSQYPPQVGAYPQNPLPTQSASYPQAPGQNYAPNQPYPVSPFGNPNPSPAYPQQQCSVPGYGGGGYGSHGGSTQQKLLQPAKGNPTVKPVSPFDPRQDAEVLRKAMKGFGTDEKAIINVLTRRSNAQRLEIATQFKTLYGKDLISDLKSELSGRFEDVIMALMLPLPEFLAKELHDAVSGIGTDEETLVEIVCTATNAQMLQIKNAYQRRYGTSLEKDLGGDTSGHFKRLLISLCQGRRAENEVVNEEIAFQDAQALMHAGVLQLGTDESTFNAILVTRSYPQLARTFGEYQRLAGHPFDQAIRSEFSGDIEAGLIAIVKSVQDKPGFFAERLRAAMVGMGTNDRDLIRIIVSRCEIDLADIKRAYQAKYGKTLEAAVEDEASGDYKKALISLISGLF